MTHPFVSAMIVTYNEEVHIQKCFSSLLAQTYPSNSYEIIIIDGQSTDQTVLKAKETERAYMDECRRNGKIPIRIRYFKNEKRFLAAGWNIGIREASGEYVVRIDAHAYADERFIEQCVNTMLTVKDADCVGGSIETQNLSPKGKIISDILSSPFGVGRSRFRYYKKAGYVDTLAYGLYRKEVFERLGYFDETLERTQDNDMHRRMRSAGGKFYLNPEIKTVYISRDSVRKMLRQGFLNGKWIMINLRKRPGRIALRHFIPLFFVLTLIFLAVASFFSKWFFIAGFACICIHLFTGFYFALKKSKNFLDVLKMMFLFFLLHIFYGSGSITGTVYRIK